mgnify:CR=1 FL=1|tara:strand:+ start:4212 stop:5285 length:1074 start_codon:yes stop_codon:yes gene_type:complete
MKSLIKRLKKDKGPNLVTLTTTRYITDDDVQTHAKWHVLKDSYKELEEDYNTTTIDKQIQSIMNSIVYQERIYFCITRAKLIPLLKSDKNWETAVGLDKNKYSALIGSLTNLGLVELHDGTKKPHIYKVTHPELLEMIKIDSEEDQLSQVIEYIENNPHSDFEKVTDQKTDQKTDRKSDLDNKEIRKGDNKPSNTVEKNLSFKQLLVIQHPDSFPSFDELDHLAQLATTNCEDFDGESMDVNTFKRHLESISGKTTPAKKKFRDNLVSAFEPLAAKYGCLKETEDIELKEPTEIKSKAIRKSVEDDSMIQNNTLNILKATFGKEKITILKRKLEKCDDPEEKVYIQGELQYWEKING